jgi:L-ascorbate metabolism protein UlaG (beta-lactamase superfamily)
MSLRITYYGHAALSIETTGYKLLIDPSLDDNPQSPIKSKEVDADFILITHGHDDHVGEAVTIAKRTGAQVISNTEIIDWFEKQGISNTHAQHIGGGFHHPFGYLKFTIAVHGSTLNDGSSGGAAVGFLLTTKENKKIYIAGDTGLFGDMRLIGEEGVDLAILPIGDNYTMGPDDALRAVKLIQPKHVIPYHYDTWKLINQDPHDWARHVESETGVQIHVLKPGMKFTL